ncbi:hypothetical protein U1Q18_021220 [Sarracenia purpurea var. burkii]
MKVTQKDSEKVVSDQMRSASAPPFVAAGEKNRALPKFMVCLLLFVSVTYVVYTLKLVSSSFRGCDNDPSFSPIHSRLALRPSPPNTTALTPESPPRIPKKKSNISSPVTVDEAHQPTELKHIAFGIAGSATFWEQRKKYIKLWWKPKEMKGVVWLDSPVKTRRGEGLPGVRISSDISRLRWMAMQFDVIGNLFGLLAAHPVAPLVSLHHLDVVEPIFPNVTQLEALQRLQTPMKLDSAGLIQQSICYDRARKWTVSVSWGFAVQVFRGVLSPREIEMPSRTFLNWYKRADFIAYEFNTRPVSRNPCQKPFVFYLSRASLDSWTNQTVSEYSRHRAPHPACNWKMPDPDAVDRVEVYKKPDPHLWERSPRRNCCRILDLKSRRLLVDVGVCREGEISEI